MSKPMSAEERADSWLNEHSYIICGPDAPPIPAGKPSTTWGLKESLAAAIRDAEQQARASIQCGKPDYHSGYMDALASVVRSLEDSSLSPPIRAALVEHVKYDFAEGELGRLESRAQREVLEQAVVKVCKLCAQGVQRLVNVHEVKVMDGPLGSSDKVGLYHYPECKATVILDMLEELSKET